MANDQEVKVIINGEDRTGRAFSSATDASRTFAKGLTVAAAAIGYLGMQGIRTAADIETARQGLVTLLGSAEDADATLARVKKEAARTPFELPGLIQATQLLSSVTKDGNKSIDVLLDVGEALAAMGKGQAELDRIIVNLQQISAVGRASSMDIRQFAFAGIPIFEMLTEKTGLAGEALNDFIVDGGVTFDLLTSMFDEANNEGGRFFNAFINQTGTLNQEWSNFKDIITITLSELAVSTGLFDASKQALRLLGDVIKQVSEQLQNLVGYFKENGEMILIFVGAIVGGLIPAIIPLLSGLAALAIALAPYMIAGALIGGVIAGFIDVAKKVDDFNLSISGLFNLVESKTGLITILREAWENVSTMFNNSLKPALEELWVAMQPLLPFMETFIKLLGVVALGAIIAFVKIVEGVLIVTFEVLTKAIQIVTQAIEIFNKTWDMVTTGLSKVISTIDLLISKIKELNVLKSASSMISSALGFGGARAEGGPVSSNKSYLVGERGPELFTPSTSGMITANNALGGGASVIINMSSPVFLDDMAADKFGDVIIQRLREQLRI